jgi:hypothetical protein
MVAHRGALRGDGDDVEERKNLRRFNLRWRRLAGELGSDYTDSAPPAAMKTSIPMVARCMQAARQQRDASGSHVSQNNEAERERFRRE